MGEFASLLPYQVDGVAELVRRDALLLADDMGLGKTVQASVALSILLRQGRLSSALVVVPAGLIRQWRMELQRWAPELRVVPIGGRPADRSWQWRAPAEVYLVSYETLRSDFSQHPSSPTARLWDVVILDEAQKIKNADTAASWVCKQLRRSRQWALTGTPLENSAGDLESILAFVHPPAHGARCAFAGPGQLKDELRQVQLRRRKADVLPELPPKLLSRLVLPLRPAQRRSYQRAERDGIIYLRALGESVRIEHVLALIARLKQICNFCPSTGESSKMDDLKDRLDTLGAEGHKALVFSQFTNADFGARRIAAEIGPHALVYAGHLSALERRDVLERFRGGAVPAVLILSVRAGGLGLNLQEASYVVHFDRWWNPSLQAQAEARSHRMGQRCPVNVYTYTCEDTIEERIEQILDIKRALFQDLVDDVSLDISRVLSRKELFGLFGLQPPLPDLR